MHARTCTPTKKLSDGALPLLTGTLPLLLNELECIKIISDIAYYLSSVSTNAYLETRTLVVRNRCGYCYKTMATILWRLHLYPFKIKAL